VFLGEVVGCRVFWFGEGGLGGIVVLLVVVRGRVGVVGGLWGGFGGGCEVGPIVGRFGGVFLGGCGGCWCARRTLLQVRERQACSKTRHHLSRDGPETGRPLLHLLKEERGVG